MFFSVSNLFCHLGVSLASLKAYFFRFTSSSPSFCMVYVISVLIFHFRFYDFLYPACLQIKLYLYWHSIILLFCNYYRQNKTQTIKYSGSCSVGKFYGALESMVANFELQKKNYNLSKPVLDFLSVIVLYFKQFLY